jgi:PTS system ascorbate-specific IIC component
MELVKFFVELLKLPAIVIGLIALIGLVVQRKQLGDVVSGTIKTTLSVLIIGGGIGVLIDALLPIQTMFELGIDKSRFETFVTFDEAVVSAVQNENVADIGVMIGWTLLFGYAFHLFLARVTPFHYVYLTGHMIWIHAGAYAILYHSFGLSTALTVALASLTVGTYFTLAPAAAQPIMRRITGSDEVAFGHGQTILNLVAAGAGSVVGKGSRTTEEMRVPEKLNFFRDIAISTTLVMLVVAFAAALLALAEVGVGGFEKAFVEQLPDGQSWVVFTLLKALGFTAGMLILLFGVRMLIAEIVPAFHGIAERLIPGAKPALDVPVIFPFAPNALIIGLISGLIGQIAGMAFLVAIDWPVPIPSMIVAFFASGAGAIFGNATGGRRGAWLGGFLWGFIGWLMISYAYQEQVFGNLTDMGATGLAFTVPDAIIPAIIIDLIAKLFGG